MKYQNIMGKDIAELEAGVKRELDLFLLKHENIINIHFDFGFMAYEEKAIKEIAYVNAVVKCGSKTISDYEKIEINDY